MADVLSWITTCLDPDTVRLVLDGITLEATQRMECQDPIVVEEDHDVEKEVCVTAGQVLVQMHVTDWAEAHREDSVLNMVLDWLEAQKKTDLKTLLGDLASSEEGQLFCGIVRTSQFIRKPYTYTQCLGVRMRIAAIHGPKGASGHHSEWMP